MIDDRAIENTKLNEGFRSKMYQCSAEKWTIGYGLNLESGITKGEATALLRIRMNTIHGLLVNKFDWFKKLNSARQGALCDMAYQLGFIGLCKFSKSLRLMQDGNYQGASIEFLDSKWARQTPERATKITRMIASGEF